ncbi:MAG: flagellar hook-basal body complex protein FliE [Maricaulaceae bacterium]
MAANAAALNAITAYSEAAGAAAPGAAQPPSTVDFGALLEGAITSTEGAVRNAETLAVQGAVGQAPLLDVVSAVTAAEMTVETVVAVRDEVIRAYQEILRMPI